MTELKNNTETPNFLKPVLGDVLLSKNDLTLINRLPSGRTSFAIQSLSEDIFNDALAQNLESFFEEKRIYADRFNVEYMGFLTGQVAIETDKIEMIIPIINEFLKNIT
jgi:hypothetical protein